MKLKRILALALLILTLVGCAKEEPAVTTTTSAAPSTSAATSTTTTKAPTTTTTKAPTTTTVPTTAGPTEPIDVFVPTGNVNPLTGLCDGITDEAMTRRPIAVMVGNSSDSLPQWGISQADIVYEMTVEGRITRLMAIFQDTTELKNLGSCRSTRPYFISMANSYGAVLLHVGASEPAYGLFSSRDDIIHIDGTKGSWEGSLYIRSKERRQFTAYLHTLVVNGDRIQNALDKIDTGDNLIQKQHPSAFNFSTSHSALNGTPANKITCEFISGGYSPYFVYDEDSMEYLRWQYGKKHYDGLYDEQVSVKNVFVLYMDLTDVKGSSLKLVEIDTTGEGSGYYFTEGKCVDIRWQKDSFSGEIEFFTAEGEPLYVNRGQSFIEVMPTGASVKVE